MRPYIKVSAVNMNFVYLQNSENSILACQDRDEATEVFRGHTCDIVDFVPREVVVLILAVTVVVVDVARAHKQVST